MTMYQEFYQYEKTISDEKRTNLGIVYTPPEIVDFINQKCLNLWKEDHPPKIIDPCCGTGVFLQDMAIKIAERWSIEIKEVYEKYIYGTDLDEFAIKEAKKLLPSANLSARSSLYDNWEDFDIIVTNPPYVRIQNLEEQDRNNIRNNFSFCVGDTDIYIAFFEKIVKMDIISGFICPNSWIRNKSSAKLRKYIKEKASINTIIDFRSKKVFPNVGVYASILINNGKGENETQVGYSIENLSMIKQKDLFVSNVLLIDSEDRKFVKEILKRKKGIFDICDIKVGLATLADSVFLLEKIKDENGSLMRVRTRGKNKKEHKLEKGILKRCAKAGEITKNKDVEYYIIFPYKQNGEGLTEEEFKSEYPSTYKYLENNKEKLLLRDKGKNKGYQWYEYGRTQSIKINQDKLIFAPMIYEGMQIKHSPSNETFISGYCITPKDDIDIQELKNIFESSDVSRWISIFGKSLSGNWKGVSKETFKHYRINKK